MTTQEQDKLWNELSVESQKTLRREYQEFKSIIELRDGTPKEIAKAEGQLQTLWALFGSHNLNPKPLTYEDVARELFAGRLTYFINANGLIAQTELSENSKLCNDYINCISQKQAEKLLAINRLLNVAKYLNGNWKPDWNNFDEEKWSIFIDHEDNIMSTYSTNFTQHQIVYFRTNELAQQTIQILGEETIRLALSTDY